MDRRWVDQGKFLQASECVLLLPGCADAQSNTCSRVSKANDEADIELGLLMGLSDALIPPERPPPELHRHLRTQMHPPGSNQPRQPTLTPSLSAPNSPAPAELHSPGATIVRAPLEPRAGRTPRRWRTWRAPASWRWRPSSGTGAGTTSRRGTSSPSARGEREPRSDRGFAPPPKNHGSRSTWGWVGLVGVVRCTRCWEGWVGGLLTALGWVRMTRCWESWSQHDAACVLCGG